MGTREREKRKPSSLRAQRSFIGFKPGNMLRASGGRGRGLGGDKEREREREKEKKMEKDLCERARTSDKNGLAPDLIVPTWRRMHSGGGGRDGRVQVAQPLARRVHDMQICCQQVDCGPPGEDVTGRLRVGDAKNGSGSGRWAWPDQQVCLIRTSVVGAPRGSITLPERGARASSRERARARRKFERPHRLTCCRVRSGIT